MPGAYGLVIPLGRPLGLRIAGVLRRLPAGTYLYAGSARGSGGIAARAGRHLRPGKAVRWHVDRLTAFARPAAVLVWAAGDECALVRALLDGGCDSSVPGFGSSDCRICPAHLIRLPVGFDLSQFAARLPPR